MKVLRRSFVKEIPPTLRVGVCSFISRNSVLSWGLLRLVPDPPCALWRPLAPPDRSKSLEEHSKSLQEPPKSIPRAPKSAPRSLQALSLQSAALMVRLDTNFGSKKRLRFQASWTPTGRRFGSQSVPNSSQNASETAPRRSGTPPRRLLDLPRTPSRASRSPPELPRSLQGTEGAFQASILTSMGPSGSRFSSPK